jgi:hypothetical protein
MDMLILENTKLNFKLVYSDNDNERLKSKLRDSIVLEIKHEYYLIDFESMPELKTNFFGLLKEENFEDLNDFYYEYLVNKRNNLGDSELKKIPSKVTLFSSEQNDKDFYNLTPIQIAFIGNYSQEYERE